MSKQTRNCDSSQASFDQESRPLPARFARAVRSIPATLNWGTAMGFVSRSYLLTSARIHEDVRIAILSDLHGACYGENQCEIIHALEREKPHVVLLLGDIFDHRGVDEHAKTLVRALSGSFRCYFIPGNHEYKSGELGSIQDILKQAQMPILSGDTAELAVGETHIHIFGIDDAQGGEQRQQEQLARAASVRSDSVYSILAIHVPNDVERILPHGFDLMLSGHTHGGQIVIPRLVNGLYAPGQGVFPKYGGGRYDFSKQTLIICRGLSQRPLWVPRLGNPPEICFVTLSSEKTAI